MESKPLGREVFDFLNKLEKNNNREWFMAHKERFKKVEKEVREFYKEVQSNLSAHDEIERMKMFRVYRDVRFSTDKTPYKTHFAASFARAGEQRRGGYYLQLKPGGSFAATGFWEPNAADLLRIRKELEMDSAPFRQVTEDPGFKKVWGELQGEEVKTAPRGFDKEDPNIGLIRKKRFIFVKEFPDSQVLARDFNQEVDKAFRAIRPYFDLMSEILTTNLNGESILD